MTDPIKKVPTAKDINSQDSVAKETVTRKQSGVPTANQLNQTVGVLSPGLSTSLNQGSFDAGRPFGISQERQRFNEQTGWQRAGNSIVRTLSELTLGTLEGAGYLLDFEQHLNLVKNTEDEFGNWFSNTLKDWQKDIETAVPIHSDPSGGKFNPDSFSWWMENVPSIASAVSLLIPSNLAVRGIGKLGKLYGGQKIAKALNNNVAIQGIQGAVYSRIMENTLEASGVYEDELQNQLSLGTNEETAKLIAANAARNTWYANTGNLAFDIPQYMSIFKGFNIAKKVSKARKGLNLNSVLQNTLFEGLEEVGQFVVGEESKVNARAKYGQRSKPINNRIKDYVRDGDLWTSFVFGSLGGAAFSGYGNLVKSKRAINSLEGSIVNNNQSINTAVEENDVHEFDLAQNEVKVNTVVNAVANDKTEQLKEDIASFTQMQEKELIDLQIDPEEAKVKSKEMIDLINYAENESNKYKSTLKNESPNVINHIVGLLSTKFLNNQKVEEINTEILEEIKTENEQQGYPSEFIELKRLKYVNFVDNTNERVNSKIQELQKLILEDEALKETYNLNTIEDVEKLVQPDSPSLQALTETSVNIINENNEIIDTLDKLKDKKERDKLDRQYKRDIESLNDKALETLKDEFRKDNSPQNVNKLKDASKEIDRGEEFESFINDEVRDSEISSDNIETITADTLSKRWQNKPLLKQKELAGISEELGLDSTLKSISEVLNVIDSPNSNQKVLDYLSNKNTFTENEEAPIASVTSNEEQPQQQEEQEIEENDDKLYSYTRSKPKNPFFLISHQYRNNDYTNTIDDFIDWQWLNSNNLKIGSSINYEIDTTNEFDKTINTERGLIDFRNIYIVNYIDGNVNNKQNSNRKIIGRLPAYNPNQVYTSDKKSFELKQLREDISKEYLDWNNDSNDRFFISSKKGKVKDIHSGRITKTDNFNNPSDILRDGDPLVFGIGLTINNSTTLRVPNNEQYQDNVWFTNIKKGVVYQLLPAGNGNIIPTRLITKKLKDNVEVRDNISYRIQKSIEDGNWKEVQKEIRKDVWLEYIVNENKQLKVKDKKGWEVVSNINAWLDEKTFQVDLNQINQKDYNKKISDEGRVVTDIKPYEYVQGTSVEIDIDQNEISNKIPVDKKIDKSETTNISIPSSKRRKIKGNKGIEIKLNIDSRTKLESNNYTPINLNEELKWFNKNLPNVPIIVLNNLKNIGNEKAWGVFHNSIVYISENAGKGTVTHEAFHSVFNLYLNEDQRKDILKEASDIYSIPESNVISLEEKLADDFSEYIINKSNYGFIGKIKNFFNELYQLLKSIITNKPNIQSLYSRINKGSFRNSLPNQNNITNETRWRVPNTTPEERQNRINLLTYTFFDVLDQVKTINSLQNLEDIDVIREYGVDNIFEIIYNGLIQKEQELESTNQEVANKIGTLIDNLAEVNQEGEIVRFNDYYYLTLRELSKFGINIKTNDILLSYDSSTDENIFEVDENINNQEGWQIKTISTNGKDTLFYNVKKALRKVKSNEVDDIGFSKYINFDELYNYLERNLSSTYSIDNMIDKLNQLSNNKPEINQIIEQLQEDESLRSSFYTNFSKEHVRFLLVDEISEVNNNLEKRNTFRIFQSNRKNTGRLIINEWDINLKTPSRNTITNNDGSINSDKVQGIIDFIQDHVKKVKSTKLLSDQEINNVIDKLKDVGIDIPFNVLKGEFRDTKREKGLKTIETPAHLNYTKLLVGKDGVNTLLNKIVKGINPYNSESSTTNNLSKVISNYNLDLYQSSFININGDKVFSHLPSTYMGKLTNALKSDQEVINNYLTNYYYKDNVWLNELYDNKNLNVNEELADNFNFYYLDGYRDWKRNGKEYTQMYRTHLQKVAMNTYFNNNSKYAYYKFPIPSDSSQLPFIKFKKFKYEEVLDGLVKVYEQERNRIQKVKEENATLSSKDKIKNFNTKSSEQFKFLYFLNSIDNIDNVRNDIDLWLQDEYFSTKNYLTEIGVITKEFDSESINGDSRIKDIDKFVQEYVANSVLANIQMIQLYSGDLSFYKDNTDFQKRNNESIKPGYNINPKGVYTSPNGTTTIVGDIYNTIYLKDVEVSSTSYDEIKKALFNLPNLSKSRAEKILSNYSKGISQTDAQSYITLDRWKKIMIGRGEWNDNYEEAFNRLKNNKELKVDNDLVFRPLKPFVFTFNTVRDHIVPVQHKNSEFVLTPNLANQSPKLRKLLDYMESNNIDSAQFTTAVKVGNYGSVNPDTIGDNGNNPVIHEMNNKDYMIQQEVPQHFIDDTNIFGTQIRRLVLNNLSELPEDTRLYNGMSVENTISTYHQIINADLQDSYNKISKEMNTPSDIRSILVDEAFNRNLGENYIDGLSINRNNDFDIPLYFPLQGKRNEFILNSIFTNRVIRRKINGAPLVNLTNYGFDEDLKIKFKDDGGIDYIEAKIPYWNTKFIPKDINGNIDLDQLPENLKYAIPFRIPTEDFYSFPPIKIVGVLPKESGGAIMLPADITTIAGLDFDVDKMFLMLHDFDVVDGKPIKIKYDTSISPLKQSQSARDNGKIDIILSIVRNKFKTSSILNPGGFENLKELAKEIDTIKGKVNDSQIIGIKAQDEVFIRNMTGKNLVGIFANQNINHSITQFIEDIKFSIPVIFDGKSQTDLNNIRSFNGEYINRTLASLLAASVDNAKEPIAGSLNLSPDTADVTSMLVRLGFNLDTVMYFISQPVLVDIISDKLNFDITLEESIKLNKDKLAKGLDSTLPESTVNNIITKDLKENIVPIDSDSHKILQLNVLNSFAIMKSMAKELNKFIEATRIDSTGRRKTLSENEVLINSIGEINRSTLLNNADKVFTGDSYPMIKGFTKYGLIEPNNILKNYFPYYNEGFIYAKGIIQENIVNKLNSKDIDKINNDIINYHITGFDFFNREQAKNLIDNLHTEILEYQESYTNDFIDRLHVIERNDALLVEFNNNGSITNEMSENITIAWENMLYSDNSKTRDIAEKLVKYSFFINGFNYTPSSFSQFIPFRYIKDLYSEGGIKFTEFLKSIDYQSHNKLNYQEFINQYIRNNYQTLNLDSYNIIEDSDFIKNAEFENGELTIIDVIPKNEDNDFNNTYIKVYSEGETLLFKRLQDNKEKGATFFRENPLGYKGTKEYDINEDDILSLDSNNVIKIDSLPDTVNNSNTEFYSLSKNPRSIEKYFGLRNEDETLKKYFKRNYLKTLQKTIDINKKLVGSGFRATITTGQGEKGDKREYHNIIITTSNLYSFNSNKELPNKDLNEKLKIFLNNFDIEVKYVDNLFNRNNDSATAVADIINKLIKVSKAEENIDTLPEEAAHFAIEMLGTDSRQYKRLKEITRDYYKTILNVNTPDGYNRYKEAYGNEADVHKEAIGQLLGKFLTIRNEEARKELLNNYKTPQSSSFISSLIRSISNLWKTFKEKVLRMDTDSISQTINEFDYISGSMLELNSAIFKESNLNLSKKLHNQNYERYEESLRNAISVIGKKLNIYREKGTSEFTAREENLLNTLREELDNKKYLQGLLEFADNIEKELEDVKNRYNKIESKVSSELSISEAKDIANSLRNINDFISSYEGILDNTQKEVLKDIQEGDKSNQDLDFLNSINTALSEDIRTIQILKDKYFEIGTPLVVNVLKKYSTNPNLNIESQLRNFEKDISFVRRWLDSLADSSNDVLNVIDVYVKNAKQKARLQTDETYRELLNLLKELEEAEITSTQFMYERDWNGNLTGNLLSQYNLGEWSNQRDIAFTEIKNRLGIKPYTNLFSLENRGLLKEYRREMAIWYSNNTQPAPDSEERIKRKKEQIAREVKSLNRQKELYNEWYLENTTQNINGEEIYIKELAVPSNEFTNSVWSDIFNKEETDKTKVMKKFYNHIIELKRLQDTKLPSKFTNDLLAPQVRKDFIERFKADPRKTGSNLVKSLEETFTRVEDDDDFGITSLTNEKGEAVNFLPIYYNNRLKDTSDLSTDIVESMILYSAMSNNYNELNKIIDILEVTKDVIGESNVGINKKDPDGNVISIKGKEGTKIYDRLEDYMQMIVYGKMRKDEGKIFGTVDVAKLGDAFGRYVSFNGLALNIYSGIQNPIFGRVMTRIEALSGDYYNQSDLLKADTIYSTELPKMASEIGNRIQTSKLQLWTEKMDTLQNANERNRSINANRKNIVQRLFKSSSLFFLNRIGEHHLHNITSLALANTIKLKGESGKEYTLWEAYQVNDKNDLVLQEQMTIIPDGKLFKERDKDVVFGEDELIRFLNKQNFINERLHGIYNDIDKNAWQALIIGRLGMMFRKFIKPGVNRRFEKLKYSEFGETEIEGYYNTTGRFMQVLYNDIKQGQFSLTKNWNDLTPMEKGNMKRSMSEVSYLLGVMALSTILTNIADEDDNDSWMLNMMAYQANRLYTEIGFLVPAPSMINEGLKILKSPAAGVSQLQKIAEFIEFWNWGKEYESGRYRGWNRFEKYSVELIPGVRTIARFFTPEEELMYFKR